MSRAFAATLCVWLYCADAGDLCPWQSMQSSAVNGNPSNRLPTCGTSSAEYHHAMKLWLFVWSLCRCGASTTSHGHYAGGSVRSYDMFYYL